VEYKDNWKEAIARQSLFWEGKMKDRILARIYVRNRPFEQRLSELKSQVPVTGKLFPKKETVLKTWDLKLKIFKELQDDSLPVMIPTEFDEGLFGGIFEAETNFSYDSEAGWMSSMANPFLTDALDASKLKIREDGLWMQELKSRLTWYAAQAKGKFGLSPVISIDALNFAVMSRGATNAMLDTYDNPAGLKAMSEFALELNIKMNRLQREFIGSFDGGTFDGYACFGSWFPGEEINMSVDAFGQCKKEDYLETGFVYNQRLVGAFGSAALHIHANAHHLLPEVVKLKGLKAIWLADENPRVFPQLREIKKVTGDVPLITECMLDEFMEGMKKGTLPGGIFYIIRGHKVGRSTLMSPAVETIEEANKIMKQIRDYRSKT